MIKFLKTILWHLFFVKLTVNDEPPIYPEKKALSLAARESGSVQINGCLMQPTDGFSLELKLMQRF